MPGEIFYCNKFIKREEVSTCCHTSGEESAGHPVLDATASNPLQDPEDVEDQEDGEHLKLQRRGSWWVEIRVRQQS